MKKGDARRSELLSTAERLFYAKGYEQTSVQDIITEMNYSKGGFYHHFDSKLSVLEAICEMRAQESGERAAQAMAACATPVEKLNALLHAAPLFMGGNADFNTLLVRVVYRGEGALMREKMSGCLLDNLKAPLAQVLREGSRQKVFFAADAEAMADLVARLLLMLCDDVLFLLSDTKDAENLTEALMAKLSLYRAAIERVLLAPFGSVVIFEAEELLALAKGLPQEQKTE